MKMQKDPIHVQDAIDTTVTSWRKCQDRKAGNRVTDCKLSPMHDGSLMMNRMRLTLFASRLRSLADSDSGVTLKMKIKTHTVGGRERAVPWCKAA